MAQPAVLEPHIGALVDWCINKSRRYDNHRCNDVVTKINLLQQLPAAAFVEHAPKLVTLVCTCTGNTSIGSAGETSLEELSFKLCLDKLEPAVRAAAIGVALKQNLQDLEAPDDAPRSS